MGHKILLRLEKIWGKLIRDYFIKEGTVMGLHKE